MSKKKYIIPIFIPHEGCPHDCSFCNQRKIAGESSSSNKENVLNIINSYLKIFPKSTDNLEIAFFGGSFTGLPMEKQAQLLTPAFEMKKKGYIKEIRLSTRPDYISKDILLFLEQYGVSIIELGVQSTDDNILSLNRRGHTRQDIFDAVHLLKQYTFKIGLQMMVGLFGDNKDSIRRTAEDIIFLKPDFLRIYPTVVIKDTHLETLYKQGEYIPFTLKETIAICKNLLLLFKENDIPVIRIGLQSTEEITYGKAIVAGPYHPAFREMVESEIYKDLIDKEIKKYYKYDFKELIIYCHPSLASRVAGYKQSNKKYFMSKYNLTKLKIKLLTDIKEDYMKIEIH